MKRRLMMAALAAALIISGCAASDDDSTSSGPKGSGGSAPAGDGPIEVLQLVSLTGYITDFDRGIVLGNQMGIEDINAAGGIGGRELKLREIDVKSDPSAAATALRQVLDDDPQFAIAGFCSACNHAIGPDLVRAQVPLIETSVLPTDEESKAWQFTLYPSLTFDAQINIDLMKERGLTRVALLADASPLSQANLSVFESMLPDNGFEIVASEEYSADANDLTPVLNKIAGSDPEAVLKLNGGPTDGIIAKNIVTLGHDYLLLTRQGTLTDQAFRIAGDDTDVLHFAASDLAAGEALPESNPARAAAVEFQERAKERDVEIDVIAVGRGYDQIMVLAAALEATGGAGGEALREALEAVQVAGVVADYAGSPDDHAMVADPKLQMVTMRSGALVLLSEVDD